MLDEKGFRPSRFAEINAELGEVISEDLGGAVDLSSDALLGVFTDIMSLSETYIWELGQSTYDSANLLSSEGFALDNLALLVGEVRLTASKSRGVVWFTGEDGSLITTDTKVKSVIGNVFEVESEVEVTATSCIETEIHINTLVQEEAYTIQAGEIGVINTYSRPASLNQTKLEILTDLLADLLSGDEEFENSTLEGVGEDSYILLKKVNTGQSMSVAGTTYFTFKNVVTPVLVTAELTGDLTAKAHTITTYINSEGEEILNVVDNPFDFVVGNDLETDEDLRIRVINSYQTIAGGTPDAMQRTISAINGVDSVKVVENRTAETSTDGRNLPPKSFQVIVYNGDNTLIAEAIWDNKSTSIQPYADKLNPLTQTLTIQDYNGQAHNIMFLRPTSKFIYIYVDYNLYSEESFTDSGELIMEEELANYGQTLGIGDDVISDRFVPQVYRNVDGVDDVEVYVALSDNVDSPPNWPADYTQLTLDITDEEVTNFSSGRVQVERHTGNLPVRAVIT